MTLVRRQGLPRSHGTTTALARFRVTKNRSEQQPYETTGMRNVHSISQGRLQRVRVGSHK